MKDTLTTSNHQDFRQRYRGTYGRFEVPNKEPILVRLIEVNSEEVTFEDSRGGNYHVKADSGIPFEFFSVERCLFNTPTGVMYSRRKPARQWARGVCSANTQITNLETGVNVSVNFSNIHHLASAKSTYGHYTRALLTGDVSSAALSNRYAVVGGKLMMFDATIGTYEKKSVTVDPMYYQEFSDFVKRNQLEITVK